MLLCLSQTICNDPGSPAISLGNRGVLEGGDRIRAGKDQVALSTIVYKGDGNKA
jgi:hypothetical protein